MMKVPETLFKNHRYPTEIIQYAVWLYFVFPLSFRDVELLLHQRGIVVSHETIRSWSYKFGPHLAQQIRRKRRSATDTWHLDEVFVMKTRNEFANERMVNISHDIALFDCGLYPSSLDQFILGLCRKRKEFR